MRAQGLRPTSGDLSSTGASDAVLELAHSTFAAGDTVAFTAWCPGGGGGGAAAGTIVPGNTAIDPIVLSGATFVQVYAHLDFRALEQPSSVAAGPRTNVFSDLIVVGDDGSFEGSLVIPSDAVPGGWKASASCGAGDVVFATSMQIDLTVVEAGSPLAQTGSAVASGERLRNDGDAHVPAGVVIAGGILLAALLLGLLRRTRRPRPS